MTSLLQNDLTLLSLGAVLVMMALVLGLTVGWGVLHYRADQLPAATRLAGARWRLAETLDELRRTQELLQELEQKVHERDRMAAEAAALKEIVEALRLEQQNLAPAREEIAKVKAEAADAAQEKATVEQELQVLRGAANEARDLAARIEDLKTEKDVAEREHDRVRSELERIRPELDAALRAVSEAREAETRVAVLDRKVEDVQAEILWLEGRRDTLQSEAQNAQAERDAARLARNASEEQREEADRMRARLEAEIASLEAILAKLASETFVLNTQGTGLGIQSEEQRKALLSDLVATPACLNSPERLRGARPNEAEALHNVASYLRDCGLSFSRRTLLAFHTALKINDSAQLTVLAGVSGTGKSLLPRRYAEAMGIHFLQVAVEPRWDSPQDLLGFYNYVEQKYRATELARLLAHLDPWRSLELPADSPERGDHMALVLLDEMNLARVEYYFSEFLSRLEARPAWRPGLTQDACKDALIPVDIRGLENPPRLFPSHKVLFAGTMNDDESTQSLSDKVLDRGNILQFPAPSKFPAPAQSAGTPADRAQSFQEWRSWIHQPGDLDGATSVQARETISELARMMQGFARPFGHRLNQAIRAYVANYPTEGNAGRDARVPLADQIEFRILPKLRGVEIDGHRERFEQLEQLVRTGLDDAVLAQRIADTCDEQARGTGLFVWRGLMRGE